MPSGQSKEKEKFDTKHARELKPLLVGSIVSCLSSDLKTLNVGVVVTCSPDHRSYHIQAENGQIISHNRVHLCETNVEFIPQVQNIPKVSKVLKEEKTVKCSSSNTKSKQSMQKQNVKSTVGSNNNYRTRSGCEVRKQPRYQ